MQFMRQAILAVADNRHVSGFFQANSMARGLVSRFVAGDTLDEAMTASRSIDAEGMAVTLDLLGENVDTEQQARNATGAYVEILNRMKAEGMSPNISIKLTMLGLDFGDDVAHDAIVPILEAAREVDGFIRIDMEGSDYTERTMHLFEALHDLYPEQVGIVIQSYLRRSERDVQRCIERKARVRLVKGAYAEPPSVAFQERSKIDENFVRLMELLLDNGAFPALATHDPALIRSARGYVGRMRIPLDSFEFQMLYGVRRDEQQRLIDAGFGMRVYVPFGTEWYPYFTRRIAERPANALFVLRQLKGG
ncbi:MAG: proline dehydrogenase family protein [Chloroflexia bacterium]|nr:proline dehydrogenase family protein [Chloroflexia bacterium]